MPYENERASRLGQVTVANSPHVQSALGRWSYPETDPGAALALIDGSTHALQSLGGVDGRPLRFGVISFDGSPQEVAARIEYPSVKVGYLQVGAVLVRVDDYLAARRADGLVDIAALRSSHDSAVINTVLPSTSIASNGRTGQQTWRDELFRTFRDQKAEVTLGNQISLLDAIMAVHGAPGRPAPTLTLNKCPECGHDKPAVPKQGAPCPTCGELLYPTDVLRTHEEYQPEASNIGLLTRVMNVAERLLVIAFIEGLVGAPNANLLGQLTFITDGPLALHGPTAPLRSRIIDYWQTLVKDLHASNRALPLWVGIEKTGAFVDHARLIKDGIPLGHVMTLANDYVKQHIVPANSAPVYGVDEFYGRRFFYRTSTGAILVVSVPRTTPGRPYASLSGQPSIPDPSCEAIASYDTLRPTLEVLDELQTRMHQDAVVPLVLAHHEAALPLKTGRNVLSLLAQEYLGMEPSNLTALRGQTGTFY